MTFFDILKQEHKEVAKLLKEGDSTTERAIKTRTEILTKVKEKLDQHTKMEETYFYPELENYEQTKDLILEAYEEHNIVKTLLSELVNLDPHDEVWGAKFTVLKENIEHHVEEEEQELFPKVKKVLPEHKINEITQLMQTFKKNADALKKAA